MEVMVTMWIMWAWITLAGQSGPTKFPVELHASEAECVVAIPRERLRIESIAKERGDAAGEIKCELFQEADLEVGQEAGS